MVICYSQIDFCHSCKNCNQYDHAALSCIFDCLSHCDIISGTVIDHICFVRSKSFYHCFSKVFVLCIDADINSTFLCFFETKVTDICDHDFGGSHSFGSLCHQVSDRTCSKDCNIHAFHIAHLFYSVNCNCQRLDHCTFLIGHFLWKWCYLGCIYCEVFGCRSGCLESHNLQFLAEIIFSMAAWIAVSTIYLWFNGDLLSFMKSCYISSKFYDFSGNFMSLCNRIFRKRMFAVIYVDI